MKKMPVSLIALLAFFLNTNSVFAQIAGVKFEVVIPETGQNNGSNVFLAGSFNCWNPHDSLYIMKEIGPNLYSTAVPLFDGQKYEYKYTLGSWETVETSSDGAQIKNRTMVSHNGQIVKDTVFRWNSPDTVKKEVTRNLNKEQMELLSKLKDEIDTKLESRMKSTVEIFKKANENILSENPDFKLRKKYHEEIVATLDSTLSMLSDLMWKVSSVLTPEQKREIITEMKNNDNPGALFEWISRAMETTQK